MSAFFLILLLASFASLVIGHFIPPLPFLEGARVYLMPLILFYGALALPYGGMLLLALVCGFMWDALNTQILEVETAGHVLQASVEIALGWSILLYATLGTIMSGFRPLFRRGGWEIHCLMSGILTSVLVLVEYLMISVRRAALYDAAFDFSPAIWLRIGGSGLAALVLAPIVYWLLHSIAALIGYNPRLANPEEEEEA